MHILDHERLRVYQDARAVNRAVHALTRRLRTKRFDLVDQLVRSSASISRNIAEGAGEFSRKQKARYYRYARASACETAATLDALIDFEIAAEADVIEVKKLLRNVISSLVKLIKSMEPPKTAH